MINLMSINVIAGEDGYFSYPSGICYDSQQGIFYISDMHNSRVCWLDTAKNKGELENDIVGVNQQIKLIKPLGITLDSNQDLLVTDAGYNRIFRRKKGTYGWIPVVDAENTVLDVNGKNSGLQLNLPSGVVCDEKMNIYTNDFLNNRILKIDTNGKITTLTGGMNYGYRDGHVKVAQINKPYGIYYRHKKLYFTDTGNNLIRYIDLEQEKVFTINFKREYELINPIAITLDPEGNIYVCEHRRMHFIDGKTFEATLIIDRDVWKYVTEHFGVKEKLSYVGAVVVPKKGDIYWVDTIKGLIYHMVIRF